MSSQRVSCRHSWIICRRSRHHTTATVSYCRGLPEPSQIRLFVQNVAVPWRNSSCIGAGFGSTMQDEENASMPFWRLVINLCFRNMNFLHVFSILHRERKRRRSSQVRSKVPHQSNLNSNLTPRRFKTKSSSIKCELRMTN
uniref:Uncharacterized protein n=1 Tax=Opuntia streptacantha TaxID=393608 RepID=A0A7C9CL98_OPUST